MTWGMMLIEEQDSPFVVQTLLVFSLQTCITTLTCLVELLSRPIAEAGAEGYGERERSICAALYGSYAILCESHFYTQIYPEVVVLRHALDIRGVAFNSDGSG